MYMKFLVSLVLEIKGSKDLFCIFNPKGKLKRVKNANSKHC